LSQPENGEMRTQKQHVTNELKSTGQVSSYPSKLTTFRLGRRFLPNFCLTLKLQNRILYSRADTCDNDCSMAAHDLETHLA
jgi:hypothetical protein